MPGYPGAVHWSGQADATAAVEIRGAVGAFAAALGFDGQALDDVRMAVSEAYTNTVVHAYRDGEDGGVEVWAARVDCHLEIRVVDHGVGMRQRADSPGLGMGLSLMEAVMDDLEVQETPCGGTTIVMRLDTSATVPN